MTKTQITFYLDSLDNNILEWIDELKGHIGIRFRGDLINKLLRPIRGEYSESDT